MVVTYWVYILSSRKHGTVYVGVTRDLLRRVQEHREGRFEGFTDRYGVHRLVWHCAFQDVREAIAFEKRLKRWRREWKVRLIERENPHWLDLYAGLAAPPGPLHPDLVFMGPGQPLTRLPG